MRTPTSTPTAGPGAIPGPAPPAAPAGGGCIVLLILTPSLVYQSFTALVLGGVLMGGVLTMTPVLVTYVAYAPPLSLPPVLWLLLQDNPLRATMGATGILYLLLALGTAQHYHQTLVRSLRQALENAGLAQSFAAAKEQAEAGNQQLAEQQAALRAAWRPCASCTRSFHPTPPPHRPSPSHAGDGLPTLRADDRYPVACRRSAKSSRPSRPAVKSAQEMSSLSTTPTAAIPCAPGNRWASNTPRPATGAGIPCYLKLKLEAYLGVPVGSANTFTARSTSPASGPGRHRSPPWTAS